MWRGVCICISIWLFCVSLSAQHRYRTGLLPQFNLNIKVADSWKANSKIESRQLLYRGLFGQETPRDYTYERTDIAVVLSHKLGAGSSLAAGYMIRITDQQLIHRFIQQYSWVRPYASFRLGHRFSTDQTLASGQPPQFRFRYRIGIDRALSGESVDPGESYVKFTGEWLHIVKEPDYDMEIRFVPCWGFAFTDNNKIELGLDYRLDALLLDEIRSNFWFRFAWFVRL